MRDCENMGPWKTSPALSFPDIAQKFGPMMMRRSQSANKSRPACRGVALSRRSDIRNDGKGDTSGPG